MGSATRWKVVFEGVAGEKGDALAHFKLYAKLSRQAYSVVYHVQLSRLLKYDWSAGEKALLRICIDKYPLELHMPWLKVTDGSSRA